MNQITKLVMIIATSCCTTLAYGGPCYTDTGNCDTNEQVILVKPKETGTGFCVETLNDKNQKETKCYYQPPQQIVTDQTSVEKERITATSPAKIQRISPNTNLVYSTSSEPIKYNEPYYNNSDDYYNNNNNSYYLNDYYNGYYNNQNYYRPHRPRPPIGSNRPGWGGPLGGGGNWHGGHGGGGGNWHGDHGGGGGNWHGGHGGGGGNWHGGHGGGGGNWHGGHGGGGGNWHGGHGGGGGSHGGGDSWKGNSGGGQRAGSVLSGGSTSGGNRDIGGGRTTRK